MPAQAEPERGAVSLLTITSDGGTWAVPSAAVLSVEPFDAPSSESTVDVLALLGGEPSATPSAGRVLVLEVGEHRLRLLALGALQLRATSQRELLPLPAAFTSRSPFVSHVAVIDGTPTLLVVSPERLLRALQATADDSPIPSPHTSEARPC